jgi:pilus assembly protein CpaE
VIDLPRHMVVQYPHLVADLQSIVVVSELTLAGARDMIRILSWLKSNAPQAQVIAAINSAGASSTPEISQRDFESSIERKADLILPYDAKATSQAAKLGKTIVDAAPSSKLGSTLIDLSTMILARIESNGEGAAPVKVGKSGSLMDKVTNLKSMLKPKAKPAAEPEPVN